MKTLPKPTDRVNNAKVRTRTIRVRVRVRVVKVSWVCTRCGLASGQPGGVVLVGLFVAGRGSFFVSRSVGFLPPFLVGNYSNLQPRRLAGPGRCLLLSFARQVGSLAPLAS